MAYWDIKNVALRGITGTVPDNPVKTADLPYFTPEEADTFDATVGIKNRYISPSNVCASIIMLMATIIAKELQERPLTLVCSAFGLGLTWATMVLKTQPLMTLPVKHLSSYNLFEE